MIPLHRLHHGEILLATYSEPVLMKAEYGVVLQFIRWHQDALWPSSDSVMPAILSKGLSMTLSKALSTALTPSPILTT